MADFTFAELTPTRFLDRAARVYGERLAIVDGALEYTYAEFAERCRRLSGALIERGVAPGDRVAALCTNGHAMLELHNAILYAGAVLVPLNIRLTHDELGYILEHSGASLLVVTHDLETEGLAAAAQADVAVIVSGGSNDEYERMLTTSKPQVVDCGDERGLLGISYTSGTTGRPKGVMYHHRGAYLQALAMAFHTRLGPGSRYLWTLPQFHCDGWCFTWGVTAAGATHVCIPSIDVPRILALLSTGGITHFSAAPTVLVMIADGAEDAGFKPAQAVAVTTGGAPPSPSLLSRLARLQIDVTHLYGLTETFGPLAINDWQPEWDDLPGDEQAELRARQGVSNVIAERLRVIDSAGNDIPADGRSVGEVVCRGNNVMLGYFRDNEATKSASIDGWLRTGDLGVMFADGYVSLVDRLKDIVITGGENVSSIEVERVLESHSAVSEAAVVGQPDDHYGEIVVAYVTLKPNQSLSEAELIEHARARLAHFKAPKRIDFRDLPKTSTGKIQKTVLRQLARSAGPLT
jgi:fatty-acyl-CoA synthase